MSLQNGYYLLTGNVNDLDAAVVTTSDEFAGVFQESEGSYNFVVWLECGNFVLFLKVNNIDISVVVSNCQKVILV
jgi:hypothetical protein